MNKINEDVYTSDFTIKKWVDKVTGKTRTRRIRPSRVTFANNLLQGVPVDVAVADDGSTLLYKPEKIKKSPTAKLVLSRERAKARKERAAEARGKRIKHVKESLSPSLGAGEYIKDFRKSKAPQFKGKSVSKRTQMAIAAYMGDKTKSQNEEMENHNMLEELQYFAEGAIELSLESDHAVYVCLDENEELYISEDENEDVIATYIDGEAYISLDDDEQLDEELTLALTGQLYIDGDDSPFDGSVINELNYDTLKSYSKKADKDLTPKLNKAMSSKGKVSDEDNRKMYNRTTGIMKADERMEKHQMKESVLTYSEFVSTLGQQ